MADYWKSQPRKFCQYCKCWIADNKPSVEFHERGKNHKENVAAKISEIKKKSIDKAKQEERMCKQFSAMEEAAQKAYEEDLKRMEREAKGLSSPAPVRDPQKPLPQVRPQVKPQATPQPKKQEKKREKGKKKWGQKGQMGQRGQTQVWVEGLTDDGYTYFYNTVTGESQWDKPAGFQGESSSSAQPEQSEESEQHESSSSSVWMEAVSPNGFTYYYNTETGESSWEKPADFPSTEAPESNQEVESQDEPSAPEPEPLSGGEESSNGASKEAQAHEQASQQQSVPKISFRKRKAEPEPEPEEKTEEDKVSDVVSKEEETKKEEEAQSTATEPVKTEEKQEKPTSVERQVKRPKAANPYGAWEQIKEEVDPYAKVDLQLPQVEESSTSAPVDLPPEPKPKFKERVITSIGDESGPASFRKNRTQNGKSRSLRQRDNDD